jgi:hypothetical protein
MAPRGIAHNSRISRVAATAVPARYVRSADLPGGHLSFQSNDLFSLARDVWVLKTGQLVKRFEQIAGRLVEPEDIPEGA